MDYPKAQGKDDFFRFKKGERLTMKQANHANCYDCTGHYTDEIEKGWFFSWRSRKTLCQQFVMRDSTIYPSEIF